MRVLTTALSLTGSLVCARISLRDAIGVLESERKTTGNDKVFINPEGPLNIMLGHAEVNNDAIAKKRMFSPPICASYVLEEVGDKEPTPELALGSDEGRIYRYDRDPKKDGIWDCTCSQKVDDYLRAYYNALKVLFRIVNGKVVVCTNHHMSFYKYTRVQLSDAERARFFAALLMLANGERGIKAEYRGRPAGSKAHQGQEVFGVALTSGQNTMVDLNFAIPNTLPGKKTLYIEEMRTVVEFFAKHGATDVEEYKLDYTDSPCFLIRAYLCECANDDAFISEVFDCVDAFLAEMYSGTELNVARSQYFTTDKKLVGEYSEQYDAFRQIDKINSRSLFPFTNSNMPLQTQLVHYTDEKKTDETRNVDVSYGDCVEITLFNFFCCMLYDPESRKYSTGHLKGKKCDPTARFLDFFTKVCIKPEENTKACIHQEWARVIQGLTRPQAADGNADAAGRGTHNLIKYCNKTKDNKPLGLKADIGTFFMVLAGIVGLPAAKQSDLETVVGDMLAGPVGDVDCAKLTRLLNDVVSPAISTRPVNLELRNARIGIDKDGERIIIGLVVLSFPPQKDEQPCYTILFEFDLTFKRDFRHAYTVYSQDVTLNEGERKIFASYDKETADVTSPPLLGLIRDSVRRFLSKTDGALLPNRYIAGVERAHDPTMLYTALTRWLCYAPMRSHPDRLAAIDQLFPTFMKLLKHRDGPGGTADEQPSGSAVQDRAEGRPIDSEGKSTSAADMTLSARNPLVLLIANIVGSVPLDDFETRHFFLRAVLTYCVDDCEKLFPSLRIRPSLYCPAPNVPRRYYNEELLWFFSGFRVPNIALEYFRRLAAGFPTSDSACKIVLPIAGLLRSFDDVTSSAYKIVNMFMTHRHADGIEFMRDYYMADGSAFLWIGVIRRVLWFYMGLKNQIYGEVYWVCSSMSDREFEEYNKRWMWEGLDTPRDLPPFSSSIVAKIFPDGPSPAQFMRLLGLYAKLAPFTTDHAENIYSMLETSTNRLDSSFVIIDICNASVVAFSNYCDNYTKERKNGDLREKLVALESELERLKGFVDKIERLYTAEVKLPDELTQKFHNCRRSLASSERGLRKVPQIQTSNQ
ncbi:hypothetical protein PAPHI01_2370 [Pancytospora philotis]|nr:hypothetical protein PAPHI01_2370 [Pancytospora philotis]